MASILSLFQTPTYGSAMADVAQMSMRPTFELQFSMIQNQVIQRINKEIEDANQDTGKIDAFLVLEKNRLQRTLDGLQGISTDTKRNHNTLADVGDALASMGDAITAAAAGDSTAFDSLLAQINDSGARLIKVDGSESGIFFEDGVRSLKTNGIMRKADGTMATSYADFPDSNAAKVALLDAVDRLRATQTLNDTKVDLVDSINTKVSGDLMGLNMDIEAARTAAAAEKAEAVTKIKEKYADMLKALSLGFEGNAAMADYFAKHLLSTAEVEKGSVMNLFT